MEEHGIPVVGVMGNNGIWALEKHPMEFLYGYSVAAELRPETRYDEMVRALGCDGVILHGAEVTVPGRVPLARSVLRRTLTEIVTSKRRR